MSSTATRDKVRQLLVQVQRVRPRTPFWNIPAHRVPTIILYRNLLREAPTNTIQFRLRLLWQKNKNLTSVVQTQKALQQGYKYLEYFRRAKAGDTRLQKTLERWSNLIDTRAEKAYWSYLARKELVWRAKLRYRPIVTGACFPASIYHKPLPRMINQPTKVSQMIRWRYEAHERRIKRHQAYLETIADLKIESRAEGELIKLTSNKAYKEHLLDGKWNEWVEPYQKQMELIHQTFNRGMERAKTPYPQPLLDQLKAARKERVLNKTRENLRIKRGETTPWLEKQLRKGPPAIILVRMTPKRRLLDKVARHPSEVGFVALAKKQLGRRLKNPSACLAEESPDKKEVLDRITQSIRAENSRRRRRIDI